MFQRERSILAHRLSKPHFRKESSLLSEDYPKFYPSSTSLCASKRSLQRNRIDFHQTFIRLDDPLSYDKKEIINRNCYERKRDEENNWWLDQLYRDWPPYR